MTVQPTPPLVALLLVVTSACTDGDPGQAAGTPTASESVAPTSSAMQLPCAETIDPDAELPDGYTVIADTVALPTADSADTALQTSQREENPAPSYFAKTGLAVRPGVAFTIEVDEPPETAQIGWGSPADFGPAITTHGCDGAGWTVFAGGFLVDEPRCVEVTVRAGGVEEAAQVGVGAPCPGQQPPPEPTDP